MFSMGLVESDGVRSDERYVAGSNAPRTERPANALSTAEGGEGGGNNLTVRGLPLPKPPYASISAIDLDKGEILWQIAHGETPDNIRNHPALKGLTIPRTGRPGVFGVLVTKSLVIAGERGTFTTPSGKVGAMLRAYDKATGKDAGAVYMPAGQTGTPMTYMLNGKQYIVLAIAGPGFPGELIAYKLSN
jgi:quinoprotein glucose dehydrogenase